MNENLVLFYSNILAKYMNILNYVNRRDFMFLVGLHKFTLITRFLF